MQQHSRSNHIDKNVILMFLSVIIISLGVVGYKVLNQNPCEIVNFEINASQYRVGEIIRFKDFTENVQQREWLFGDDSEPRYTEDPFHTFEKPGTYDVRLIVNGKCESEQEIVIKEKLKIIDSTRIANFTIPNTIEVGQLLKATDNTKKATSWEWRFGETSEVNSTFQNPTYVYETPGLKLVTLIVNGDPDYSSQKKITVIEKQVVASVSTPNNTGNNRSDFVKNREKRESLIKYDPGAANPKVVEQPPVIEVAPEVPKEAEVKKAPTIGRKAFAEKVLDVGDEKATANDFKQYMCGNLLVTTMYKGKKTTFLEFCEKISGKKRLKIKKLEIFKNEKSNCIEYISID